MAKTSEPVEELMVFLIFARVWVFFFGLGIFAIASLGFVLAIPNLTGPVPIGWGLLAVSVLGALGGLGVMEVAVRGRP